jgi:hypothetical protein
MQVCPYGAGRASDRLDPDALEATQVGPVDPCPTPSEQAGFEAESDRSPQVLRTSCAQCPKNGRKKGPSESLRALALESIGATGFEPAT